MSSGVETGAGFACAFPSAGRVEITVPEGPGSALQRSDFVDGASAFSVAAIGEENAGVFAAMVAFFFQAHAALDHAHVFADRFLATEVEMLGESIDFFVADPDVSGPAGAAIATLRAREAESVFEPGLLGIVQHVQLLSWHVWKLAVRDVCVKSRRFGMAGVGGVISQNGVQSLHFRDASV